MLTLRKLEKPHGNARCYVDQVLNGKRKRKFFATEKDGKAYVDSQKDNLKKLGFVYKGMSPDEISDYIEARRLVGEGVRLADFIRAATEERPVFVSKQNMHESIKDFLRQKEAADRSEFHVNTLRSNLRIFERKFKDWDKIHTKELLKWLLKRGSPKTIKNYYGSISNLCNYAVRRKWIDKSPIAEIHADDLPSVIRGKKGILTPQQTNIFFGYLNSNTPQYLPYFAIQAFAGIRREEAKRIKWEMIDLKNKVIIIPAEICKTADSWRMDGLPNNLWSYLKCPEDGIWHIPSEDEIDCIHSSQVFEWPKNALRHSFCTYHLSLYRDPARTALLLRHTNQTQLYQSYLAAIVDKKTAADYFAVVV